MRNHQLKVTTTKSKPFLGLETRKGIVNSISIFEVSKIIFNRDRLEVTVLYTSGDKDVVKFSSPEAFENAMSRFYAVYSSVFLKG